MAQGSAQAWPALLLAAIGAPRESTSEDALLWWAQSEGMPPSANNWLATTEPGFGGTVYNSAGVRAYPTEADGIAATKATLENGSYAPILAAFRGRHSLAAIWEAVNASPWCSGCQGGKYPVVLYDNLGGSHAPPPPPPPPSPKPGGQPSGQGRAEQAWADLRAATHPTAVLTIADWILLGRKVRRARK